MHAPDGSVILKPTIDSFHVSSMISSLHKKSSIVSIQSLSR